MIQTVSQPWVKDFIPTVLYNDLSEIAQNDYFDNLTSKHFLITGGSGFIAYYIALSLLCVNDIRGCQNHITLLVRNEKRTRLKYGELLKREDISLLIQDVCSSFRTSETRYDYMIHAASAADSKHFHDNPIEVFNSNVIGTENLIDLMRSQACTAAVFLSSFTVYGSSPDMPEQIDENYCGIEPWDTNQACYSYGKRGAEFLCMAAAQKFHCPIRIVRPGFVYGASSKNDTRVYAEIIRSVAENKSIELRSSGYVYRSMIYVTDLVRGIFSALFCGADGEAYNVAYEHISIRRYAEIASNCSAMPLYFSNPEDACAVEPARIIGKMDTTKLRNACGWNPKVSIEQGITMAANIYNELL